jgi:hypothetical protein
MKRGFPIAILAALLLSACERSVDTPTDTDLNRPYLHDLQIFPEAFNTDTVLVNGATNPEDVLTLSFDCIVIADGESGSAPPTIRYNVSLPAEDRQFAEGYLKDDGKSPDLSAGDGIYTGKVTFSIKRVDIGRFDVAIDGYYNSGSTSNTVRRAIDVFRSSRPPDISAVSAPDTVILPGPGKVSLILITLAASDPDGLGDIKEVFFRNLDSPSDTMKKFFLYDDGHVGGVSGDSVANDGIFSITVQLPYGTPAATYRFLFEATDRSGLASNTILHPLAVLNPE